MGVSRLASLLSRRRLDEDLDEEIHAHLEELIDELVASGMSREEALGAARREFGNVTLAREASRDEWRWLSIEDVLRDIRHAVRMLRKSPAFTTVAVLTLALGIGANTAIFSLINGTLLRPLPFAEPDRLVRVFSTRASGASDVSTPNARDLARDTRTFEELSLYDAWRKGVSGLPEGAAAEQQMVGLVQSTWFDLLRVRPLVGHVWTSDFDEPGRNFVVVLGERIWRERFHADPRALGAVIRINEEPYTVIGVVPDVEQPWLNANVELWTPFVPDADVWKESTRGDGGYAMLGRLKPGVSLVQARADLGAAAARLAARYPADRDVGVSARPLAELRSDGALSVLWLLSVSVGLILLIACANLANLLLARNATRRREFAVRAAIGAGRLALVRTLLTESLLLSLAGGVLALFVAHNATLVLARAYPTPLTRLAAAEFDWRVLVFASIVSLATTVLFGMLPALAGSRVNVIDALRDTGRSDAAGARGQRLRRILVVSELALSLVLLIGAGLLLRSLAAMQHQDLGFPTDRILTARFILPATFRLQPAERAAAINRFSDEFSRRLLAQPGVERVTISTSVPPEETWQSTFSIDRDPPRRMSDVPEARFNVVDWRYCSTIGAALVRGRNFTAADVETAPPVALVNETLVKRFFRGTDPLGQHVSVGSPDALLAEPSSAAREALFGFTIVGILRDTRNGSLRMPTGPEIITLARQTPAMNYGFKRVTVRTSVPPETFKGTLQREFHALNPDVPLTDVVTMTERVASLASDSRFATVLLGIMAGLAVLLAVVGTYGVVSYLVSQRSQEFGVRLALGASRGNILWLTLRDGLSMAILGVVCGLAGAFFSARALGRFLYGVSGLDPLAISSAAALLLVVAGVASAIPARRAARVDPMVALRAD